MENKMIKIEEQAIENGQLLFLLPKSRKGFGVIDTQKMADIQRVYSGKGMNDLIIYQNKNKMIIKPISGLIIEIQDMLYRLVKKYKNYTEYDESLSCSENREVGKMDEYILLVPSDVDVEYAEMRVIYDVSNFTS